MGNREEKTAQDSDPEQSVFVNMHVTTTLWGVPSIGQQILISQLFFFFILVDKQKEFYVYK